jgi:hypothetical protein
MNNVNFLTKKILRLIKEENESERAFDKREVLFFKYLTKYRLLKQAGSRELYDFAKKNLPSFGFNPDSINHYFNLFTQNYRADGKYEDTKVSDLIDYNKIKPKRTSNVDAWKYVNELLPFKGSNLEGNWEMDYRGDWGYIVTSYDWYPIYIYKYKKWFEVSDRYSSSTGKQMSRARPTDSNTVVLNRKEMNMVRDGVKFDEFKINKSKSFTQRIDKLIDSGSVQRVRMGWDPRLRVYFVYSGVRVSGDIPEIDIDVMEVTKMVDNSIDREAGDFFKGEMNGVSKNYLEDLFKEFLSRAWADEFGENESKFKNILVVNVNYTK